MLRVIFVQDNFAVSSYLAALHSSPELAPSMDASTTASSQQKNPFATGWSIAEVERDTGIGKDTLRVWERQIGRAHV